MTKAQLTPGVCDRCGCGEFSAMHRVFCQGCGKKFTLCKDCRPNFVACSDTCRQKWRKHVSAGLPDDKIPQQGKRPKPDDGSQAKLFDQEAR